jgi:copper chaperone CopZ
MIRTYTISGMTCSSCEDKVKNALESIEGISNVVVSKDTGSAKLQMSKSVLTPDLQDVLGTKYKISSHTEHVMEEEESKNWLTTYKPLLLVFFYIVLISFVVQLSSPFFNWMQMMQHFMAGFFLTFSFFKLLNLKGFAESYAMYDIVAKKIPAWGYLYAFTELALGIAYLLNYWPITTNLVTFLVMSVSIIGVLQSVLNKKKIQCACLGTVFNLPMSTVTIVEDALMIAMSVFMLFSLL